MKTLALDLDGKNGLDTFIKRRWIIKYLGLKLGETNFELFKMNPQRYADVGDNSVRVWHTVNGWHLELDLDNEIDNIKAVLIQALLGDDYRRAMALFQRIERGCKNWNKLYRKKYRINEIGQRVMVSFERFDPEISKKVKDLLELGE